jgi:hypothetical protein
MHDAVRVDSLFNKKFDALKVMQVQICRVVMFVGPSLGWLSSCPTAFKSRQDLSGAPILDSSSLGLQSHAWVNWPRLSTSSSVRLFTYYQINRPAAC